MEFTWIFQEAKGESERERERHTKKKPKKQRNQIIRQMSNKITTSAINQLDKIPTNIHTILYIFIVYCNIIQFYFLSFLSLQFFNKAKLNKKISPLLPPKNINKKRRANETKEEKKSCNWGRSRRRKKIVVHIKLQQNLQSNDDGDDVNINQIETLNKRCKE